MEYLIEYVKWRGDLSFTKDKFNDIDVLVLSQISYLNFEKLVSPELKEVITLNQLWNLFKNEVDFKQRADLGMLLNKKTVNLFEQVAMSERFGNVKVSGYINKVDVTAEEQFSAVTYFIEKSIKNPVIIFRGTDDTIVGWKEDFNMAFLETVPAQIDALFYLNKVIKSVRGKIIIAGHSKGGNISIYSACYIDNKHKGRIEKIYNLDGPGFTSKVINSPEYKAILPKIVAIYPYKSVVGMFFEHPKDIIVVQSSNDGIWQHDVMSWKILGKELETTSQLDSSSIYFNKVFNSWISNLDGAQIQKVVDSFFDILELTGVSTNSELTANLLSNSKKIIKAIASTDKSVHSEIKKMFALFLESAIDNVNIFK